MADLLTNHKPDKPRPSYAPSNSCSITMPPANCSKCRSVQLNRRCTRFQGQEVLYCSGACQTGDWNRHKRTCPGSSAAGRGNQTTEDAGARGLKSWESMTIAERLAELLSALSTKEHVYRELIYWFDQGMAIWSAEFSEMEALTGLLNTNLHIDIEKTLAILGMELPEVLRARSRIRRKAISYSTRHLSVRTPGSFEKLSDFFSKYLKNDAAII